MSVPSLMRASRLPYFLLLLLLLITSGTTLMMVRGVRNDERSRFEDQIKGIEELITRRLDTYQDVLRTVRSLFLSRTSVGSSAVGRLQFGSFADSLELSRRYPGVQALGYAPKITQAELASFEKNRQLLWRNNFTVFPKGDRGIYFPILYISPNIDINRVSLGFDLWSDDDRRTAMSDAIDHGNLVATEGLSLMPGQVASGDQKGFSIFAPLYTPELPVRTAKELRSALQGFAFLSFRMQGFMESLFGNPSQNVGFEVFDRSNSLLFRSFEQKNSLERLEQQSDLNIAGRTWKMHFYTLRGFINPQPWAGVWGVLLGGLLVSWLVFSLTRAQAFAKWQSERMNARLNSSQTALSRARAEFETMFSAMGDVAVLFDIQGDVIRCNAALWTTFGLNPERLRGHSVAELYAETRPARASRFRARYRRMDSTTFMGEAQRSAVYSVTGEIVGYVEIIRDITESLVAAEALENALRLQRTFLAETSHELRTPLTAVLGYVRRAHRELDESNPTRESLEDALRVGENMSRLVSDLLQLSRGELVQEYIPHFVDLSGLLEQISRDHGVELKMAAGVPLEMIGDPQKLQQMLSNLISNALRVCGGPSGISVCARLESGNTHKIILEVCDRGPGIPDEIKAKVFDKFFRGKEAGSAGLGLTISQQIAHMHASEITIHDTPGGGATFRILLDALLEEEES